MSFLDDKMKRKIAQFDAFPKVEKQLSHSTESGGILTMLVFVVMGYLCISEFYAFWSANEHFEFLVDPTLGHDMSVSLDLDIGMKCEHFTVDVVDSAGHSLHLTEQFKSSRVTFDISGRDPTEGFFGKWGKGKMTMEGCRIIGRVKVNKVAGNLHITALGHGHGGIHVDHSAMNFTHRFNGLSFGPSYPKKKDPLDGSVLVTEHPFESFQYFVSVVPTIYTNQFSGRQIISSQYAVKSHRRIVDHTTGGLPGIFIKYDIESLLVRVTDSSQSFITTVVRLLSIAGGIFVTVGLFNSIFLSIYYAFTRRPTLSPTTAAKYFDHVNNQQMMSSRDVDMESVHSEPSTPSDGYAPRSPELYMTPPSSARRYSSETMPYNSPYGAGNLRNPYPLDSPATPHHSAGGTWHTAAKKE